MRHPFDLDPRELEATDLDFEEELTAEEAERVGGGLVATTMALGEEGGSLYPSLPDYPSRPVDPIDTTPKPEPKPTEPIYTTLAIGEEGGEWPTMDYYLQ
jgi:hypothetical protein